MNINPSDTDVRQGYSASGAYSSPSAQAGQGTGQATTAQTPSATEQAAKSAETDEKSAAAIAAADKMSAQEAARKLGEQLNNADTGLKIKVLDDNDRTIQVEVVDHKSNKVLRKIPEDELIKLSASIQQMTGVLINKPA